MPPFVYAIFRACAIRAGLTLRKPPFEYSTIKVCCTSHLPSSIVWIVSQQVTPLEYATFLNIIHAFPSIVPTLAQLLHTVTHMPQTEPYVHVIALDFSKAFDTVRHHTFLAKFSDLPISDCTYNLLLEYFSKRRHCTRVMDIISGFLVINASIVQGSSIGPVSYVINASDLRTICLMNKLFKYADDT